MNRSISNSGSFVVVLTCAALVIGLLVLVPSDKANVGKNLVDQEIKLEDQAARNENELIGRRIFVRPAAENPIQAFQLNSPGPMRPDEYRTFNGRFNNLANTKWGSADSPLKRMVPPAYEDHISSLARQDVAGPREISNAVSNQHGNIPNSLNLTDMFWQWGQFVDHDLDMTKSQLPEIEALIPVPTGDPYFDPNSTGTQTIYFLRSASAGQSGFLSARQQRNSITAWLDGSNVYGSSKKTADSLRSFLGGQMLTSGEQMLPRDGNSDMFIAGDERCNEQSGLICMHTLFVREHNRIAARLANEFPAGSDEELYQNARKEVIAILQSITYNEFLPLLLGPSPLSEYEGYDSQVCPDIANVFSTSAYRFGHSMLNSNLLRLDNEGNVIPEGNLPLGLSFFNPNVVGDLGIEPYLKGLITQIAQKRDTRVIGSVRNFLFGQPGSGGFDLAALNIQRGRDHGLPDYNTIRAGYDLPRVTSFAEITSDVQLQNDLQSVYDNVDEIDPWIRDACRGSCSRCRRGCNGLLHYQRPIRATS